MNNFLNDFKKIIRGGNYTNTYKMAWGKALVELSAQYENSTGIVKINFSDIAQCVFKYYWNQTIYFDLIQSSNINEEPYIIQTVKYMIELYYSKKGNRQKRVLERAIDEFAKLEIEDDYDKAIFHISNIFKKDVSYRFPKFDGKTLTNIYIYNKKDNYLYIESENLKLLNSNQDDLYDLLNYRWSLILENFNTSPRIIKKVKIIDEREIKRQSLDKFKKLLDIENPNHTCFICGKHIEDNELSIDHVIPWSYMYSDDLWNLVYVHRSCNSTKSNLIPDKKDILRLKQRNMELLKKAKELEIDNKDLDKLRLCIEKDKVNVFWIGYK